MIWIGLFPIILAVIALIAFLWLFLTQSGQAVRAKMQAAEEGNKSRIQQARNILTMNISPENLDKQRKREIAQALRDLQETKPYWSSRVILATQIYQEVRQAAPLILSKISPVEGLHEIIFDFLVSSTIPSQELYNLALSTLEAHPSEPKSKQLVLKIGRYHFGKLRGGKVTIYDEQAIQNDIQVRSR